MRLDEFRNELLVRGIASEASLSDLLLDSAGGENPGSVDDWIDTLTGRRVLTGYQARELKAGHFDQLRIGNYVLLEPSGMGGMGQVFRARCVVENETVAENEAVAIKLLLSTRKTDSHTLKRFEREIRLVQQVEDSHVVRILDVVHDADGQLAIVMPWMTGGDLESYVQRNGPIAWEQAIRWTAEAAEGLRRVHDAGILHRDIKPSNLLLDSEKHVVVADFGVAKAHNQDLQSALTRTGGLVGTVDYLAPEAARGADRIDQRSDLYSLACATFFLIVGEPPFTGSSAVETLIKHGEAPRPRLRLQDRRAARVIEPILQRWMAIDPEDRPATAAELIKETAAILSGEAFRELSQRRRWRAVRASLFAAAIALLVAWPMINRSLDADERQVNSLLATATVALDSEEKVVSSKLGVPIAADWNGFFTCPDLLPSGDQWSLVQNAILKGVPRAAWFPNGTGIVTVYRNQLRVHESETGRLVAFHQSTQNYRDCDIALGNRRVAALTTSNAIDILNESLQVVTTWNLSSDSAAEAIRWSPDGRHLAVQTQDGILLLDAFGRQQVQVDFTGIVQFTWSPDSMRLLLATSDASVSFLELDGTVETRTPPQRAGGANEADESNSQDAVENEFSIDAATWLPKTQEIIVMTSDGRLLRTEGQRWVDIPHQIDASTIGAARGLSCDHEGRRLRFYSDRTLHGLWLLDGDNEPYLSSSTLPVRCQYLACSPTDDRCLVCYPYLGMTVHASDGRILWSTVASNAGDPRLHRSSSRFYEIGLSWTGKGELLVASRPARLQRWSPRGQLLQQYVTPLRSPQSLVRRENGSYWVVSEEFLMMKWDVEDDRQEFFDSPLNMILYSNGRFDLNAAGDCAAVADRQQTLKMADFNVQPLVLKTISEVTSVIGVQWHANLDQFCVSQQNQKGVQVCGRDGKPIASLATATTAAAAWIPGTQTLLVPTKSGIKVWDSGNGTTKETAYKSGTPIFSRSGKRLIIIWGRQASLWDPQKQEHVWSTSIPLDPASVTFSDDDSLIAAVVSGTEAVVVLDAANGSLNWCMLSGDQSDAVVIDGRGDLQWGAAESLDRRAHVYVRSIDSDTQLRSVLGAYPGRLSESRQ